MLIVLCHVCPVVSNLVTKFIISVKDLLPQNKKYFLVLCSPVNLLKTQHFYTIWKIKAVFLLVLLLHILCSGPLSCGIAQTVIQGETGVTASARLIR